jgi:hypothetical protein
VLQERTSELKIVITQSLFPLNPLFFYYFRHGVKELSLLQTTFSLYSHDQSISLNEDGFGTLHISFQTDFN